MARSKYGNRRVEFDGITFELGGGGEPLPFPRQSQQDGDISDLCVHPSYELAPGFKWRDEGGRQHKEQPIRFEPDFTYHEDGRLIAEDVTGRPYCRFQAKTEVVSCEVS